MLLVGDGYPPNPYKVRPCRLRAFTTSMAVIVLRSVAEEAVAEEQAVGFVGADDGIDTEEEEEPAVAPAPAKKRKRKQKRKDSWKAGKISRGNHLVFC